MVEKKNILFVCKYNRFRSKIAEAFLRRYDKNKKFKVKSAGIIEGSFPLCKSEVAGAKRLGIALKGKPKGLTTKLLKWQDTIIIVASDVPVVLFKDNKKYRKRTFVWKVKDNKNDGKKEIENIIKQIERNVKGFVNENNM